MKTKEQIREAINAVGPVVADLLEELVRKGQIEPDPQVSQFLAALDSLRWVAGDDDRPFLEYLVDRSRAQKLLEYIENFSRSARQ